MDDRTHILNPKDNVHHYYNKNKLCIILFYFSSDEINKKTLRAHIWELKTALSAFQRFCMSANKCFGYFIFVRGLYAGKLCEQAWKKQLIVLIIHSVQAFLRYYDLTLTHQAIGPNKFMIFWQKPQFMLENIDYNNSEVFILLQVISRR